GLVVDDGSGNVTTTAATGTTVTDGTTTTSLTAIGVTSGNISVDGTTNTVTGLSNTDLSDPSFATEGRAATEEQLQVVSDVANAGWDLSAQDGAATNVAPGGEVNLRNADGNLTVTQTTANGREEATFDLADDVELGSSLTVTDGPRIDGDGIDMGDDRITGVGTPVDGGDAANKTYVDGTSETLVAQGMGFTGNDNGAGDVHRDLGQILAITGEASAAGTFSGTNLKTVTDPDTGAIQLQMADAPQFGDVTINADDSGRISGVADGDINEDSADAVNGSQLWETQQALEEGQMHYYSVNDNGTQGGNYANDGATGMNAIASGVDATATADGAIAMGDGATASEVDSVAMGSGATTEAAVGTADIMIGGQTYAFAGVSPIGTFSVGSAGAERTITHVAAGRVTADSTDAINGSQLYATNQAVGDVNQAVGDVEDRVTNVEGDVDNLDGRVTNVEGDVSSIGNDLAELDDRAVKYDTEDGN
ncbi:hypothetical protein NPJ88_020580, partial [Halomonas elongata]|nr:hypothetical protein [Halomonas elongata]